LPDFINDAELVATCLAWTLYLPFVKRQRNQPACAASGACATAPPAASIA